MNHVTEDAARLSNSYMDSLSRCIAATNIMNELIEEKLKIALNMVMKNKNELDNSLLKTICAELGVNEIFWYNPDGRIIYSSYDDHLGWQAKKGHPVYDFMHGNEDILIEPIRADTETGIYYKYGYLKTSSGEFVQIGILADEIQRFTCKFSTQTFIDTAMKKNDLLYIHFIDHGGRVIASSDSDRIGDEYISGEVEYILKAGEMYYIEKTYENAHAYEVLMPINVDDRLGGILIIAYSLTPIDRLIKNIILATVALLSFFFIVHGFMAITIGKKNREIEHLLYHDPLTGFLNENYFLRFIEDEIIYNRDSKALILVCCSNHDLVRLVYGRRGLEDLLVEKANIIKTLGIDDKHLFIYPDNNFFIYIDKYKDKSELERFSRKVIDMIDAPIGNIERSKFAMAKIGILELDSPDEDIDEITKKIDIVLDEIKRPGKDRYFFFSEELEDNLLLDERIENGLKKATREGYRKEFYLEYQPQIDLRTNKIVGLEALARWNNDELGHVPPYRFINIAEKSHLIIPLGDWLLNAACEFIKRLEDQGIEDIKVAVNISVIQLLQKGFTQNLMNIIQDVGIDMKSLELEITETSFMSNYEVVNEKLDILRDRGISIALDDFGTGYSSLSRLKNLNIDVIKIDKAFIDNVTLPGSQEVFVSTIMDIASKLGLKTVAEGVETEEQRDYLLEHNCDIMQGYLFSRPKSENEIIMMLSKANEDNGSRVSIYQD
ncbi:MAG: EAL domain-containing protein [Clostridiales bacterium]|nr:EAL domain-containing protein [Clostridiales bacterium]